MFAFNDSINRGSTKRSTNFESLRSPFCDMYIIDFDLLFSIYNNLSFLSKNKIMLADERLGLGFGHCATMKKQFARVIARPFMEFIARTSKCIIARPAFLQD